MHGAYLNGAGAFNRRRRSLDSRVNTEASAAALPRGRGVRERTPKKSLSLPTQGQPAASE